MANTTIVFKEQKKRRSWLRILVGLAVLLIALVIVVYFVVTNPAFIKGVVLPRVGDALHANITVSDVSFSPFKQIVLRDLKVQAIGQAPVFTASEVNIRYHLWDILRGNIHVDEVALNSPTMELIQNPDGSSNLDPLLKAWQGKSTKVSKPEPASSKAPPIDLGRLALRNVSLVEIKNYGGGRSNVLALTNLDLTLSNVKNGQSAALQVSAALRVDENPPGGTNGFLAAAIQGNFNFTLTPDLNPASASGKAQLSVSSAGGAFGDFSAFAAGLNCDVTPTEIRQLDLHFENAGTPLGDLAVNGPLDLEKIPDGIVGRHPFPGPGLAIRIPGAITREKLELLRKADAIFLEEIHSAGLYDAIWQAFAVLLPVRTVGVMGDGRTYDNACALRAVTSSDGMTADVYPFDMAFLTRVANRIVNEVRGINRVTYDITSKPPGTIEWE